MLRRRSRLDFVSLSELRVSGEGLQGKGKPGVPVLGGQ